jgi:hypothetical protein
LSQQKTYLILAGILFLGILVTWWYGFKYPPKTVYAKELSGFDTIIVNNSQTHILSEDEIFYWKSLKFTRSEGNYPGETPDFVIKLTSTTVSFTAMYNHQSDVVFFSFIPEVAYSFFNSPPLGGWTLPIYETKADKALLDFLRISLN